MIKNYSVLIATQNGSGSQSSNQILAKSLFRSGYPVGAKNIFPSNIAGLPTWFTVRVNSAGYTSMERQYDLVVAKNGDTILDDSKKIRGQGHLLYDKEIKISNLEIGDRAIPIPYRELTKDLSESIRMRKLLSNIIDLGILTAWLGLDLKVVENTLRDFFSLKETVIDLNLSALRKGHEYASHNLNSHFIRIEPPSDPEKNEKSIYIDGNSAAALGALVGGCTFFSWYPITPATSLAESFQQYCNQFRLTADGQKKYSQIQAEDELSAISMVIGAGWAGCRAMTSTSGPGLSLMAEGAGLSYFAEVPAVIWDVQRAGPSTGLPTRTLQGDLRSAAHLSHGDTTHLVLIPGDPKECFEMAQTAFDLADQFQTLVIVLSELDVGMNFYSSPSFNLNKSEWNRGKVLDSASLDKIENYSRYQDIDGDGIGYRTLPGTQNPKAAYFTRGTAHNEQSGYTEDNNNYRKLLDRLKVKIKRARKNLPAPVIDPPVQNESTQDQVASRPSGSTSTSMDWNIGIISCGGSQQMVREIQDILIGKKISSQHLRVRALPLSDEIQIFISKFEKLFILDQNRDGQLKEQFILTFSDSAAKFHSICQYDGLPPSAEIAASQILESLNSQRVQV